jgi:hypothetical protein
LIEDGRRIIEQLPQDGFEVTAAFWLKKADDGEWRLYIVSPVAEPGHLSDAYSRLHSLIRRLPEPRWIDPLEVRLLQPSNPMAKDVLAIYNRTPGPKTSPIRWGGNMLGNVSVDGAYLYPLPVTASN